MTTPLTMMGNLTADPSLRLLDTGDSVATLRLASNSRYRDPATGEWRDGGTLFLTVSCWRALAVNAANSLRKGDRVVVHGRLRQREYESDGVRRTVTELEADALGPDLSRVTAALQRPNRLGPAVATPVRDDDAPTPPLPEDQSRGAA
jgi:single-strand DNA-binding protein